MNKLYIKLIITLFSVILANSAFSAEYGSLSGQITDAENGSPLLGATIRLKGTALGANSREEGKFEMKNITPGKYEAFVTYVGYESQNISITIESGKETSISIQLSEKILETGEVVVSANKRVQQVQEVPISISVVDLKTIEQRNITEMNEVFQYVPGVQMNGEQVSIRGSSGFALGVGSRVALLIDGFPFLSGDSGEMKLDALSTQVIKQVEVVKGAGSALYGTSALGGVINIITKEPSKEPELKLRAFSGVFTKPKYDSWIYQDELSMQSGADVSYSQRFSDLGVLFSAGIVDDQSYRDFDDALRYNLFGKVNYKFNDFNELSILSSFASSDHADWVYWNSLDSATLPPTDVNRNDRILSTKFNIAGQYDLIFNSNHFLVVKTGMYNTSFELNRSKNDEEYRASDASSINTEVQMNSRFAGGFLLTSGLNYVYNNVDSFTYGDHYQNIIAFYSQAELKLYDKLLMTLGARADYEKTEGSEDNFELSPKIGFSYEAPFGTHFRLSAGRGFRAPMVAEKYAAIDYSGFSVVPNIDLKPEVSWSAEFGLMHDLEVFGSPVKIDLSIFDNEFSELIEPSFDTENNSAEIKFKNVTKARILGAEIDIKAFLFGMFGIETALSAMDPRDLTLDETLKYRSKYLWYNRIYIPFGDFELQADYRYISEIVNVDELLQIYIPNVKDRVAAHVLDARLIWNSENLTGIPLRFTLNAKNLLDYYYLEMVGNLAPSRYISLQIDAAIR
jgi:outer membrane receptor for ferrienterochelin and colicins